MTRERPITVRSRRYRRTRHAPPAGVYGLAGVAVVLVAAVAGLLSGNRSAAPAPNAPVASAAAVAASDLAPREPTPLLARCSSLYLRLPVAPDAVTQVAFHQASGDKAVHLEALVPDASVKQAAGARAVVPPKTKPAADDEEAATIWNGTVIRLWRSNRRGAPDTAIDCGADPGTDVVAPLSGVVVAVRPYKLYGRYDDFEIHIRPDGADDLDLVLIHVDDVSVKQGERVEGGVTRIARVRKMSDKTDLQLAAYTRNGGDHVHIQLNRVEPSSAPSELDDGS
ncbi:MAG: M23 family metallopeptidase [Anaerosomatales bacterium]|nr:M23 family metallopeptidase [Anaerosomatales bacterium]